jgi:hypothetical protein
MYRRKVYGIVDLLSALGGLSSLIFYIFGKATDVFARSEYKLAIFNQVFRIRAQSFSFKDFDIAKKFDENTVTKMTLQSKTKTLKSSLNLLLRLACVGKKRLVASNDRLLLVRRGINKLNSALDI